MSRLAIINSETLLGQELKEALATRPDLCSDLRLLTATADDAGTLTHGLDGASFVQPATAENLESTDLVFICPGPPWEPRLPPDRSPFLVWVAPSTLPAGAPPVVAGINLERTAIDRRCTSPSAAVIASAMLLAPLARFGVDEVVGWIMEPASSRSQQAIDELLEQTRSILSFRSDLPTAVSEGQLAFNLLPSRQDSGAWARQIAEVLELGVVPQIQVSRGGVFHGVLLGLFVRFIASQPIDRIRASLLASRLISASEKPAALGPIEAAGSEALLLGMVEAAPATDDRAFWLRAVLDNLTVGGAGNALAVAEALLLRHA